MSVAELDLVGGTIDLMFDSISTAAPLVEAGKLRAIAVTGKQRVKALSTVPTMDELGLRGFDVEATYMVIAPAKTPSDIVARLSSAIADITRQPNVQRFIEGLYARPYRAAPRRPEPFCARRKRSGRA